MPTRAVTITRFGNLERRGSGSITRTEYSGTMCRAMGTRYPRPSRKPGHPVTKGLTPESIATLNTTPSSVT